MVDCVGVADDCAGEKLAGICILGERYFGSVAHGGGVDFRDWGEYAELLRRGRVDDMHAAIAAVLDGKCASILALDPVDKRFRSDRQVCPPSRRGQERVSA